MARRVVTLLGGALLLGSACGGGDPGPGPDSPTLTLASPSGDGQAAPVGSALPQLLRVLFTHEGSPVAGRTARWEVLAAGGSTTPSTSMSGADGIATTSVTLPPFAAIVAVEATSSGVHGSPLRFSVTATGATTAATVRVANNEFQPRQVELKAGGTVSFIWSSGSGPHNVRPVFPSTIPASANPPPPGTHSAPYSFTAGFPNAGTFSFFCEVHGTQDSGMRGTIAVVP